MKLRYVLRWVVGVAALACNAAAWAQSCTMGWLASEPMFGRVPEVSASVVWDPDGPGGVQPRLVMAGDFFRAGPLSANRVAAWDGAAWAPLGVGFPADDVGLNVEALAVHAGQLYAGGREGAPPAQVGWVARWTGEGWNRLESPGLDAVSALHSHDGMLLAGGDGVRAWDGTGWHALGDLPDHVLDFVSCRIGLVAGSYGFRVGTSPPTPVVWRWDGTAWLPMSDGLLSPFQLYYVSALHEHEGVLYAAGDLRTGSSIEGVVRWDEAAATWLPLESGAATSARGIGLGSYGASLAISVREVNSNDVRLVDGDVWVSVGQGLRGDPYVRTMATYAGLLVAGGDLSACRGDPGNGAAAWNGNAWAPLGEGLHVGLYAQTTPTALPYVSAGSAVVQDGDLYVGGVFEGVAGVCSPVAVHDGAGWSALAPSPLRTAEIAACGGSLIAAGMMRGPVPEYRVARWDGASWELYPSHGPQRIESVDCFGGAPVILTFNTGYSGGAVRRWNGSSWAMLAMDALAGFEPRAVSVHGGTLYVLGRTWDPLVGRVAAFDGDGWTYVGGPLPFVPLALSAWEGGLVSGGSRIGSGAGLVALLQGSDWTPMGAAAWSSYDASPAEVHALQATPWGLFAAGSFHGYGDQELNSLARWDGSSWRPVGGGLGPSRAAVLAMADHQGSLVVAGRFTTAGGVTAPIVARWLPRPTPCYADCDCSGSPALSVADFTCFLQRFAAGDAYANCDQSTTEPVLNVADFTCFLQSFAAGCP